MADVKTIIEQFDGAGDAAFRVTASSLPEAFAGCGLALSYLLLPVLSESQPQWPWEPWVRSAQALRVVRVSSADHEGLLVDFLNELIVLFDGEAFVGRRFNVKIVKHAQGGSVIRLEAEIQGLLLGSAQLSPAEGEPTVIGLVPKAVSYHLLKIAEEPTGVWSAQFVLDA